jgi:shikimate kinase
LLCLAGFMGSGKTTVGRLLAQQLGWRFVDLDSRIEETSGQAISRIFEQRGEPAFRELEFELLSRIVGEACDHDRATVIALGGGTFAQPRARDLLRAAGCVVLWLDCAVETLLARLAGVKDRPLFRDEQSFRALYAQRRASYELADHRVHGEGNPKQVMEEILALQFFGQLISR